MRRSVALLYTVLLTGLLSFPACQAYELVIVLGAWILRVCLICYLVRFCCCVLMIPILVMLMGMPGICGVGWQGTVHVMFFYFGTLIFGYLFSYSGLVATFILDWLLVS